MQLSEFLASASADHTQALAEAQAFTLNAGQLIPATTINQLFAQLDLTGVITDVAEDVDHPARHKLKSVLLSVQGNHDFNFITGTTAGDGNLLMLDWLIAGPMSAYALQLEHFKSTVSALANRAARPFANATLHDVLVIRNACPTKPVTQSGGWVTITTTVDCPAHRPQLHALNSRTGQWQRVNNFGVVSTAGTYDCRVPPESNGAELAVDDPYGVIV